MNKFNLKKRTYRRVLIMFLLLYAYSYSDSFAQSCNDDISVFIASRVEGTILNSEYSTWTLNAKLEMDSANNISYQWSIADKVISNNYFVGINKKGVYAVKVSYDINGIKQSVLCSLKVEWVNTNSVTINGFKYTRKENTKSQTKDIINLEKIPLPHENERPNARDDIVRVQFNKRTTIKNNIALNDNDPDGDTLRYSIVRSPQNGRLSDDENWTYRSNKTAGGKIDKFVYEVCDREELCDHAKVIVIIEEPSTDRIYVNALLGMGISSLDAGSIEFDYGTNRGVTENAITNKGRSSIGFGVEMGYFFTNNIAIATGIQYNRISGKLEVNNFKANYQSDYYNYGNDTDWDYERIVSIDNLTEKYTITNITIPLSLKFKATLKHKIGMFANVGILYNIAPSIANNLGGGTIDYEAIYYSVDGMNYGYDNTDDKTILTESYSNSNNSNNLLNDATLNLGTDIEAVSMDDKIDFDSHIGLLGRIGLTFNLSENMSLLLGGQYTSGSLSSGNTTGYRIADLINSEGKGEYNSPLNGGVGYSTFGLNIGVNWILKKR